MLILNRHAHSVLFDGERCLLPLDRIEPHLVTHTWAGVDRHDPRVFPHTSTVNVFSDEEVEAVCSWIIEEHGVRHVIALHEKAILMAARLRSKFGLPGIGLPTATVFRDKLRMKQAAQAAGLSVPAYAPVDSEVDLWRADWSRGPKVLKPRLGLGSEGVAVVADLDDALHRWRGMGQTPGVEQMQIEEFVSGAMYHCDAVVEQGRVTFAAVSEYVARPGDFAAGGMGGSLHIATGELRERILRLNDRVIGALGLPGAITHLEVFHTARDELVFLEIAARPGGGGIDRYLMRAYGGLNIFEAAIRLEVGMAAFDAGSVSLVDRSAWGVLGFYPGGTGAGRGGISPERFAEFGIAEHKHNPTSGGGPGGGPRHCTDYIDRYVVNASDRESFLKQTEEIRAAYAQGRKAEIQVPHHIATVDHL